MKKALVIYHGGCTDGFGAAFVANRAFKESVKVDDVVLYAASYGRPYGGPDLGQFEYVAMVDFSYPEVEMMGLVAQAQRFTWIDHHVSASPIADALAELASPNVKFVFDISSSGTLLTYRHFYTDPVPLLFRYIDDRDLWKFSLRYSHEVSAYISSIPHRIDNYEVLMNALEDSDSFQQCVFAGASILNQKAIEQERAVARAYEVIFPTDPDGFGRFMPGAVVVPIVNTSTLQSEVVGALAETHQFAVGWWVDERRTLHFSLRSRGDAADVSVIAKAFGGGGHRKAAGFTINPESPLYIAFVNLVFQGGR